MKNRLPDISFPRCIGHLRGGVNRGGRRRSRRNPGSPSNRSPSPERLSSITGSRDGSKCRISGRSASSGRKTWSSFSSTDWVASDMSESQVISWQALLRYRFFVLGGGMSNVDELYQRLPEEILQYTFTTVFTTPIVKSKHGDSSGVRGAAWLWAADPA